MDLRPLVQAAAGFSMHHMENLRLPSLPPRRKLAACSAIHTRFLARVAAVCVAHKCLLVWGG
jgi:hypothetical protein